MKKDWTVSMIQTDHSFLKTLSMEIIDGRDFSKKLMGQARRKEETVNDADVVGRLRLYRDARN